MHENHDGMPEDVHKFMDGFLKKYTDSWYSDRYRWALHMLAAAMEKAGSADPIPVAKALEGMTFQGPIGEVEMRADDHQIQLPLIVSSLTEDAAKKVIYKGKNFEVAFRRDGVVERARYQLADDLQNEAP